MYDKHTIKLLRIQFREQLCSLHAAQCWLTASKYYLIGNRKHPKDKAMIASREKK